MFPFKFGNKNFRGFQHFDSVADKILFYQLASVVSQYIVMWKTKRVSLTYPP